MWIVQHSKVVFSLSLSISLSFLSYIYCILLFILVEE